MPRRINVLPLVALLLVVAAAYFIWQLVSDISPVVQSSRRVVQPFPPGLSPAEELQVKTSVSDLSNDFKSKLPKACYEDPYFLRFLREYIISEYFDLSAPPYEFREEDLAALQRKCTDKNNNNEEIPWSEITRMVDERMGMYKELIRQKLDMGQFLKWFIEQFDWFTP